MARDGKEPKKTEDSGRDSPSVETLVRGEVDGAETCFARLDLQENRCSSAETGVCCSVCHMGPCRITKGVPRGACGADRDTIVARKTLREVVGGTAAHADHARRLVLRLKKVAEKQGDGYEIKDEKALRRAARLYRIDEAGRGKEEVARDLANLFLSEFTAQEEPLKTLTLAPVKQQNIWRNHRVDPQGIDRMVVESIHRTTMGVDHEPRHLLLQAFRVALADGWGASRIATIVSDVLLGTPAPVLSDANLGVLDDPKGVAVCSVKTFPAPGFSVEAIKYMLGGTYRASFRPLNDAIMQGRIKGVVGIMGCESPKRQVDSCLPALTRELTRRNVLVLVAGCGAPTSAREGILTPEAAVERIGGGLRELCEAMGMPPVLPLGGCVHHSRILEAATEIVLEGGLGDDLSQIPAVAVAPEWMSEKAVAIVSYFVASGIDVVLTRPYHLAGSARVSRFLNDEIKGLFGASFHPCEALQGAVAVILDLLDAARERLGIHKKIERKLFDMRDRRGLDV